MTTDPIAAARALIAAQPVLLFRCDLCSDECNCHPHHDMSMSGEHILCDECEDFDKCDVPPDPATLIATLADALAEARAENQRLREALGEIVSQIDQGGSGGKVFARDNCIQRARAALRSTREGG